jgi:hypothetical protein
MKNFVKKVFYLYYDGFRSMTIGKKLWMIIIIKLFIMFAILKLFFFPDFLGTHFKTDKERSDYVIDKLTQ